MDTFPVASDSGRVRPLIDLTPAIYSWMHRHVRAHREPAHMLLLTTTGKASGDPQTVAVGYFEEGSDLVVASNYGSDQHPTWYLNLRAHPQVNVQVNEDVRAMVASTASPAERTHLFARLVSENTQFRRYQHNTAREIPLVLLRPA
jgi:deazaflavin-dependent oxidoreductase (nitroreductase family)